jgi:hypothetical protein
LGDDAGRKHASRTRAPANCINIGRSGAPANCIGVGRED